MHADDVEKTLEYEKNFAPAGLINRYRCKDGSYRWLDWIGLSKLRENFAKEEKSPALAIARDITLQKGLEKKIEGKTKKGLENQWYEKRKILEAVTEIQTSYINHLIYESELLSRPLNI